jgi:hypothetical protein
LKNKNSTLITHGSIISLTGRHNLAKDNKIKKSAASK